jgi:hypothetical protein
MRRQRNSVNNLILQIADVNDNLLLVLDKIGFEKAESESFYILVSELQGLVEKREVYLKTLVANNDFKDQQYLVEQLNLSQTFTERAMRVMEDCRALIQVDNNAKRYIKAYKAIESNR